MKVCGVPLDDWADGGYADGLLRVWWVGFSSLGSWPYSEEWVWTSKLCCIAPGKWNVTRVAHRNLILCIQCCLLSTLIVYQWRNRHNNRVWSRKSESVTLFTLKTLKIYFITSYFLNSKFKLHRMDKFFCTYKLQYTHCFFPGKDCNINIFDMKNKGWLSIERSIMKCKHNSWSNFPKTSKMFF